jgi:hypothetical protein
LFILSVTFHYIWSEIRRKGAEKSQVFGGFSIQCISKPSFELAKLAFAALPQWNCGILDAVTWNIKGDDERRLIRLVLVQDGAQHGVTPSSSSLPPARLLEHSLD